MDAVTLAYATRATIIALQSINDQMSAVQIRLATGKRVNSAFDNPAAFFTASSLSARAATLQTLLDGVVVAQKTVEAAGKGMIAIESLLQSAQNIANSALLSASTLVKATGTLSGLVTSTVIATTAGSATQFKAGDTVTISDGTTTATYTAANNDTVQTFLDAVNNTAGLKVQASLNSSGQIQLQGTSTNNVIIGGVEAGSGTLTSVLGLTAGTTTFVINTTRQSYAQQYDSIRTQIDQVISDATYNGQNLLGTGNLNVFFNESGTSKLTLSGLSLNSAGLGLAASTNQFQADSDINTAVTNINAALASLQGQSGIFSSNSSIVSVRNTFIKTMIDTLKSGSDSLLLSDSNADKAALLALQTHQQLAASTISISNGPSTATLKLFGL